MNTKTSTDNEFRPPALARRMVRRFLLPWARRIVAYSAPTTTETNECNFWFERSNEAFLAALTALERGDMAAFQIAREQHRISKMRHERALA